MSPCETFNTFHTGRGSHVTDPDINADPIQRRKRPIRRNACQAEVRSSQIGPGWPVPYQVLPVRQSQHHSAPGCTRACRPGGPQTRGSPSPGHRAIVEPDRIVHGADANVLRMRPQLSAATAAKRHAVNPSGEYVCLDRRRPGRGIQYDRNMVPHAIADRGRRQGRARPGARQTKQPVESPRVIIRANKGDIVLFRVPLSQEENVPLIPRTEDPAGSTGSNREPAASRNAIMILAPDTTTAVRCR